MESLLGKNIKCLRRAFGETQEELGAVLHVEKNTVSSYEGGNRKPDIETIAKIADHYMVSIDELYSFDFTAISEISEIDSPFLKAMEVFFPVFTPSFAMENEQFSKAVEHQKEFYGMVKKKSMQIDSAELVEKCVTEYNTAALDDSAIELISKANFTAIMCVITSGSKAGLFIVQNCDEGYAKHMYEKSGVAPVIEAAIDGLDMDVFVEEAKKYYSNLETSLTEQVAEFYQYPEWRDLGEYYSSILYMCGVVNNDNSWTKNRIIGIGMLENLSNNSKNKYAIQAIKEIERWMDEVHKV